MTLEQQVHDLEVRVRKLERLGKAREVKLKETNKATDIICPNCGYREYDGNCSDCGFDATEIDIY